MHSLEFLFLQHNCKRAVDSVLYPSGPLIKVASILH